MTSPFRCPNTNFSTYTNQIVPHDDDDGLLQSCRRYYAYIPHRPGSQITDAESFHCYEQAMRTPSAGIVSTTSGASTQMQLRLSPGLPPEQRNYLSLGRPPPAVKGSPQAAFWAGYTPCHHEDLFELISGGDSKIKICVNPLNSWEPSLSHRKRQGICHSGICEGSKSTDNNNFTPIFHRSDLPFEIRKPENWLIQGHGHCMVFRHPKDVVLPPIVSSSPGAIQDEEQDQFRLYLRRDGHVMSWSSIAYNWPFLAVGHAARGVYERAGSKEVMGWYCRDTERGRREDERINGHGCRIPYLQYRSTRPLRWMEMENEVGPKGWCVDFFGKDDDEEEEQIEVGGVEATPPKSVASTPVVAFGSSSMLSRGGGEPVTTRVIPAISSSFSSPLSSSSSSTSNSNSLQSQRGEDETNSSSSGHIRSTELGRQLMNNKGPQRPKSRKSVSFHGGPPPNTPTEPRNAAPVNAPRGPAIAAGGSGGGQSHSQIQSLLPFRVGNSSSSSSSHRKPMGKGGKSEENKL